MVEDVLKQRNMIYDRNGKDIYVYGNDVDFIASLLNTVPRRPMQHGVLNARENMGQHIMRAIIKRLLAHQRGDDEVMSSHINEALNILRGHL